MLRPDNNTVALMCMTLIVCLAMALKIEGAKEITLAIGGALGGWIAKERQ